jgi:hypothetical protein
MSNLRKRIQMWHQRRTKARLDRWERNRANGKIRFVIRVSLIWIGVMVPLNVVGDYFSNRVFRLSTVIYFSIAGPIVGFVNWWVYEGEYRAAKIDARMKALNKH